MTFSRMVFGFEQPRGVFCQKPEEFPVAFFGGFPVLWTPKQGIIWIGSPVAIVFPGSPIFPDRPIRKTVHFLKWPLGLLLAWPDKKKKTKWVPAEKFGEIGRIP